MINISLPPKYENFKDGALQTINMWFSGITERCIIQKKSGLPVTSEVPTNQWGVWKDTSTGNVYLVVNDAGTIKKVQLV